MVWMGWGCLLSPWMLLTKICMVGSGSADEAREQKELMEVMLLERMMPDVVCDGIVSW